MSKVQWKKVRPYFRSNTVYIFTLWFVNLWNWFKKLIKTLISIIFVNGDRQKGPYLPYLLSDPSYRSPLFREALIFTVFQFYILGWKLLWPMKRLIWIIWWNVDAVWFQWTSWTISLVPMLTRNNGKSINGIFEKM